MIYVKPYPGMGARFPRKLLKFTCSEVSSGGPEISYK